MKEENYRPLPNYLTICKSEMLSNMTGQNELGLFATKDIYPNTTLGMSHVRIEVGSDDIWIRTPLGGFYNHSSSEYNCISCESPYLGPDGQVLTNMYTRVIRSIKLIPMGSEILLNYDLYDPTGS